MGTEHTFTADQIATACADAGITDSQCESLMIALHYTPTDCWTDDQIWHVCRYNAPTIFSAIPSGEVFKFARLLLEGKKP